jgi:hypothetical protein
MLFYHVLSPAVLIIFIAKAVASSRTTPVVFFLLLPEVNSNHCKYSNNKINRLTVLHVFTGKTYVTCHMTGETSCGCHELVADKSATNSRQAPDVSSLSPTNSRRLGLVSSLSATSRVCRRLPRDVSSLSRVCLEFDSRKSL